MSTTPIQKYEAYCRLSRHIQEAMNRNIANNAVWWQLYNQWWIVDRMAFNQLKGTI